MNSDVKPQPLQVVIKKCQKACVHNEDYIIYNNTTLSFQPILIFRKRILAHNSSISFTKLIFSDYVTLSAIETYLRVQMRSKMLKSWVTFDVLLQHKNRIHASEKPLKKECTTCGKIYLDTKALRHHVKQVNRSFLLYLLSRL